MKTQLEPLAPPAPAHSPTPVEMLLADKRSPATRRAYRADLCDFFGGEPGQGAVQEFLALPPPQIALRLAAYKARMLERGLSEATINRRLAAIRSLLKLGHRLGLATTDGRGLVDGEKVRAYRDTRGVDVQMLRRLIELPDTATVRGLRDSAILRLLAENALRRAELCAADVGDFSPAERRLWVLGKGKGTQKQPVTLSSKSIDAIAAYLLAAGHADDETAPLFRNVDHRPEYTGERLTHDGLYYLVDDYGRMLGLRLTPHKLRHSAITAALDATSGDVRRVQKLSRHALIQTLLLYDDNRVDLQGEVTELLSDLL
jgi:integrase/recombinase XerC